MSAQNAIRAILSEMWAIDPGYLHLLAAIAQRNVNAPEIQAAQGWSQRDYQLMAGPGAIRLDGASNRTFVADGVAIIPVVGPILPRANLMTEMSGATSAQQTIADLRVALASDQVGAVLFQYDTPGGAVSGMSALSDATFNARKAKPIGAFVSGAAASAGYWHASQTMDITVDRAALVGNIGIVSAQKKQVSPSADGYIEVDIVSSNAQNKRPDPTTEDGLAEIRATLDAIEGEFIADVARGRGISAETVIEGFGKGGVKVGKDAVAAGMADRVGSFESALKRMQQMARANKRAASLKQ